MTSRTTTFPCRSNRRPIVSAFTLIELVIVLLIITAMVTVTVPYATRSNEGLKLEQACRDVAEGIKYAMNHAVDTKWPTRFAVDLKARSYVIEAATGINDTDFEPLDDSRGGMRYLGSRISIVDVEGFMIAEKNRYCLVFDPGQPWPHASISLTVEDAVKTIRIAGKVVDIEDQPD